MGEPEASDTWEMISGERDTSDRDTPRRPVNWRNALLSQRTRKMILRRIGLLALALVLSSATASNPRSMALYVLARFSLRKCRSIN